MELGLSIVDEKSRKAIYNKIKKHGVLPKKIKVDPKNSATPVEFDSQGVLTLQDPALVTVFRSLGPKAKLDVRNHLVQVTSLKTVNGKVVVPGTGNNKKKKIGIAVFADTDASPGMPDLICPCGG